MLGTDPDRTPFWPQVGGLRFAAAGLDAIARWNISDLVGRVLLGSVMAA